MTGRVVYFMRICIQHIGGTGLLLGSIVVSIEVVACSGLLLGGLLLRRFCGRFLFGRFFLRCRFPLRFFSRFVFSRCFLLRLFGSRLLP